MSFSSSSGFYVNKLVSINGRLIIEQLKLKIIFPIFSLSYHSFTFLTGTKDRKWMFGGMSAKEYIMSLQQLGGTSGPSSSRSTKRTYQLQALAHSPCHLGRLRKGVIKLDSVWPRLVGQRAICIGSNDTKNLNWKMLNFSFSVFRALGTLKVVNFLSQGNSPTHELLCFYFFSQRCY